jgi:hypothetical protein
MQLSAFPKGHDKALKAQRKGFTLTPSQGQPGTWAWIRDRYYIRVDGGQSLKGLPKGFSETLRRNLERRNQRVRIIRLVLIGALVAAAAVVAL